MASIDPNKVVDAKNLKSLDDLRRSPELHSEKPPLKDLQNLVTPYYAASWIDIGLQLGIANGILQIIKTNFQADVERCCAEMFTEWLDTDVTASWGKLIQVIDSPAIKKIISGFNKSQELTESEAVEMLENKLKDQHKVTRYKSSQIVWFSEPEHFTSVALIHQKKHKTKREIIEFANMHLKGDFTESGKITTDIAEIFKSVECNDNPYTLLIEGAPGIGKTILSKEIVFQWAKGKLLKNEKLVCLIYLRDPKVKTLSNFESFVNYISYSQVSKDIEQYVCKKSGKGISLVFDGYDEYPEDLRNRSFLADLINHKVLELQLCNIVITSRPSASACLHNIVDLRVEILGFTKEHRKSYIDYALKSSLKDNPNAITSLLEYLESSYSVDAYCHIPLTMAILVFLYKESNYDKNKLPTTQTEINYKFICITIRRFIERSQQQSVSISKFSDVPATHNNVLLEISKLAFTALEDDKIVFSASEIRHFCPSLLEESVHWNGLDLLKAVQYFSLEENKDELSFNFLHFSVQELLAAYHISLMSKTKQIKLLKETFWNIRYFNVWIMYVALTKDRPFTFKHFLSGNKLRILTKFSIWWSGSANIGIAKKMKEDKVKCLHLFQCFTEAGNDDMCHYVSNLLQDGTIDLSGQALSAIELYTLSSFLARCVHRQWDILDLSNCYLDDENFERFYKSYASLTKSTVYINTVNLSSNVFTQASASQIADLVLNFNIKKLVFAANEIKDLGIDQAIFVALLEHPNLVQTRFIEIQDENVVNIILYKKGVNKSELFIMYYCTIETCKGVCSCIENNSSIFEILLNANNASMFETMLHSMMSKMTSFSTNFTYYVKTTNSISEEVNSAINSLASNVPLAVRIGEKCLPLHLYNIFDDINEEDEMLDSLGTILFTGKLSIRKIHSMFRLFLGKDNLNQIYLSGIDLYDYFIDVTPKCTSLNSLQLLNCYAHDITRPNAVANVLSRMLTASLKHLNLSACRFKTEHMKVIYEALKETVGIKTIAISDNNISKEISDILSTVIACNRELQCVEVSNCYLQETGIMSITKALENCEDLQSLDLSNNIITDDMAVSVAMLIEKCQSIKDLRLQNCRLHYTGMQKIVEMMVKKTCLHYIDTSYNPISDQHTMLISNVIVNSKTLQKLNFANCKLQNTNIQQLFQAMAKITSLVHLDVSGNVFTDVVIQSFDLMVHQNVSLGYLNISGCCSEAKDFEEVTHSLFILKSLIHLDLSCNVTSCSSVENIAIIIANNSCLNNLYLPIKCDVYKSAFPKIIDSLQSNHHLKFLHLKLNSIYYEEATGIATVISNNPFLENIDLSNCNLTQKEVKVILSSLKNHTSLKYFDMSSNTIINEVINEIVDVIDSNTQLTHLNISDTNIQGLGILRIFKAAQRINTLKSIKLCNCTINKQAAQAIAEVIVVNCMIEELVFTNNDFHETGISMIFDVLREAHTMKFLTIAYNTIISNVTTKLTEVVSNNRITYFDLSHCDLQKSNCLSILNSLILQAPNLQYIDLSGNYLSGNAKTIAKLISVSYYLQHVNLANTLLQKEEVMLVVKAMQNINSLHNVDLTSYSINDELALELQMAINKNPAMISFQVSRVCLQKFQVNLVMPGKNIFSVVVNLQLISICFNNCENNEVGAVTTLINNNPDIQYLHLENCSFLEIDIGNFINAITRTTTLEYFCLVNIVITDEMDDGIATVLENNIQLKHFKLVACKVTKKGLTNSIQSFSFKSLSHVILSEINNLISHKLKRPICNSLTHLNISNAQLNKTKLSYLSLPALTKLQHLDLSHNPLTDESADILSSVILNNNGLQHLDLCACKLQSEGIRVVADSLQAANVTYLDMSLNTVDIVTFNNNVMPVLLCSLKVMECLYLPYCELKQKEIIEIVNFINNALHLKFIDLGPNMIPKNKINDVKNVTIVNNGNRQISFSAEGLMKVNFTNYNSYHSLHYLNINNITVDDEVGNSVATLIANSPELEHLEMSGGKWNMTTAAMCFKALQNHSHLKYLYFSNSYHSSLNFTLTEIFALLTGCSALKFLDLHNCCRMKDAKVMPMTTEAPKLLHLNYLNLNENYIDDGAVNYLAVLIATNVDLEYLNLHNCNISSSGIQIINNALKSSSGLKFLDIRFNDSDSVSLFSDQVATLLVNNKHLEQLWLSTLVLDNSKFHQVQSHIHVIKGLQQLIINNCFFTEKDGSKIISLIANNPKLHKLALHDCEMSVKSQLKFSFIATALYLQYLKLDTIIVMNSRPSKHVLNTNISLHCNKSRFTLTDNDVVAAMTVDNQLGELIMFKLILNQNSLRVLSTNAVTIRYLKVLCIQDCIFTDDYAQYVAFLITNNATTIQSFSLTSCQLSTQQQMTITKALCKLDILVLHYLNIRDILYAESVKHEAGKSIMSSFTKTNCKLTDDIIKAVMIDNINLIISKLAINQIMLIEKSILIMKGLSNISINGVHFTDSNADNLATLINNNKSVESFDISDCVISDNGKNIIFEAMINCTSLKALNLRNIVISDAVEDKILDVMANNTSLEYLVVTGCEMSTAKLSEAISSFNNLKIIF